MSNNNSKKVSFSAADIKEIFFTGLKLCIFMSVICIMLYFVNSVTSEKIAEFEAKKINDSIISIMGDDGNMTIEPLDDLAEGNIKSVFRINLMNDEETELLGYCISATTKGYGGNINLLIGLDANGAVKGVSVISDSETAGIGKKVLVPSFLAKFNGKTEGVSLGNGDIAAVSGATITSKAVTKCVDSVLSFYESTLKEVEVNETNS